MLDLEPRIIGYERPYLYDLQSEIFFGPHRYGLCESSTKAGKTHGCLVWLTEKACLEGFKGWNGWWIAPSRNQAKIAYKRLKNSAPKGMLHCKDTDLTAEFPNGAVLFFKTAEDPDALYGEDVYAAVYDEASRGRYDSWIALRSTLTATGGPVRLIGNVKGKSNWFYQMCRAAERGKNRENTLYRRINAYDAVEAGILPLAEVEDAKKNLTEKDFLELYMAEAQDDDEAFIPSDCVIAAAQRQDVLPYGALVIGGDPSQGRGDPAAFCLRRGPKVIRIEEHPGMDEIGFISHAIRLIEVEKPAKMFLDGTGFGTTIGKVLHEKGYGEIVSWFHMAERATHPDQYYNKRAECAGEGRKWLQDQQDLPSIPDDEAFIIELTCFKEKPNTSGRILLEDKDDLKARGFDSPNMAEAFFLTFAEPIAFVSTGQINYPKARRGRIIS